MINGKRLKYPPPLFTSLTILIRLILSLLAFNSLLHCSIRFSYCICFSPPPSTKAICAYEWESTTSASQSRRRSCVFSSIWIKASNKWKI